MGQQTKEIESLHAEMYRIVERSNVVARANWTEALILQLQAENRRLKESLSLLQNAAEKAEPKRRRALKKRPKTVEAITKRLRSANSNLEFASIDK